jgi:hypothetical protein
LVGDSSATHIAVLSGDNVVPPVITGPTARGVALLSYDPQTRELRWTVEYAGLSGPVRGGHLHGPAAVGANADINIGLAVGALGVLNSPINGLTTLSEKEAGELEQGLWYVDLRTDDHPGGEVRGQIINAR